jgi:hypothetical protein
MDETQIPRGSCPVADIVYGSLVAEVYSSGKPVKLGEEPAEAKTMEFVFPESPISRSRVTLVKEGKVTEKKNLALDGGGGFMEAFGKSTLELTSGENWGVFYTL